MLHIFFGFIIIIIIIIIILILILIIIIIINTTWTTGYAACSHSVHQSFWHGGMQIVLLSMSLNGIYQI